MDLEQGTLDLPEVEHAGGGAIERAACATIAALREHGALDATHTLKVELILQGARALDTEFKFGKVTVAGMQLYARVLDTADGLPTIAEAVSREFERIAEALANAE